MSMLEKLKADQLTARKAKDSVATALLTTLIGEASKVSDEEFKKGLTTITDEKVIVTIKKFLKNAEEAKRFMDIEFTRVMGHSPDDGKTRPVTPEGRVFMEGFVPKMRVADREIAILNEYLPQQMDEFQLREAIDLFKTANPDANMGAIMAHLKAEYAGLYDGKLASSLAKG
jgi:uncharacterized protein YqeY